MAKQRLDVLLVERGFFESREKAQAAIMAGGVLVNGKVHTKPGTKFLPSETEVEVVSDPLPYVSRGGLKLEKAIKVFGIDPTGKHCLDVGASTGGFTDCLLQHGAEKVVAVDVGYGQLAWSLRQDPRVIVMEKTNIRHLRLEDLPFVPDVITVDTSFISVTKFLHLLYEFLQPEGELVSLIKPQFEAGPHQVGKGGIVRDPGVQKEVLASVLDHAEVLGFSLKGLTFSPVKGTKGNVEFLAYFTKSDKPEALDAPKTELIERVVKEAQQEL
ncbi:MAG: TlyA family RNA methyltransferase [Firmicutes bacterium]|nr:TlyA family RNA methyltransferase [Bacillota bacterium]